MDNMLVEEGGKRDEAAEAVGGKSDTVEVEERLCNTAAGAGM